VRKKLDYDLDYLRSSTLAGDFRILFKTVRVMFTGKGAQ